MLKLNNMNTLQVINYIANHPEFTNIVIKGLDDKHPMEAIYFLSGEKHDAIWRVNGTLDKNILLIY
jgi:hypothetical protein